MQPTNASTSRAHPHHPGAQEESKVNNQSPSAHHARVTGAHHGHRMAGHRRAKSAGQASSVYNRDYYASHYAATGLYAHQSGEHLDAASIASAAASQLWTIAPIVKRTTSEKTIRLPAELTISGQPPPYSPESHGHHRKHSSIKYASLKQAEGSGNCIRTLMVPVGSGWVRVSDDVSK